MQNLKQCKKILIEVNQTCNLNCTYCFYRDYGRIKNNLDISNINSMLETCPIVEEFYLTGGECFTSPNIEKIIKKLSSRGKVIVFTNGVILNNYNKKRLLDVVNNVDRFIISFDSFNEDYKCRQHLDMTLNSIKKILQINDDKVEVKVCITKYNYKNLEQIFKTLIDTGVKYLSVNFIFDILNSDFAHEVTNLEELKEIFKVIRKYKNNFNMDYISVLQDLYINQKINDNFPCIADSEYFYLDSKNDYSICPGNCKKLGKRGDWKKCFSKECANEWEIMYMR